MTKVSRMISIALCALLYSCFAGASPKKGDTLCVVDGSLPQEIQYLRGTGYFWLDYRYRGVSKRDQKPVVLLIRSPSPHRSVRSSGARRKRKLPPTIT